MNNSDRFLYLSCIIYSNSLFYVNHKMKDFILSFKVGEVFKYDF